MRVAILAGGRGKRLAEVSDEAPKPMMKIGEEPILWHVMSHCLRHGLSDFVVALGYGKDAVIRYFVERMLREKRRIELDFDKGILTSEGDARSPLRMQLIDTGIDTSKAGRLLRLRSALQDAPFLMTYCDGLSDVDLAALRETHQREGRTATVTAVRPPARFGRLTLDGKRVLQLAEKQRESEGWINGGYLVIEPRIFDHLREDADLEGEILAGLAEAGELAAYRHDGFWACMDTAAEKRVLNDLWSQGRIPEPLLFRGAGACASL